MSKKCQNICLRSYFLKRRSYFLTYICCDICSSFVQHVFTFVATYVLHMSQHMFWFVSHMKKKCQRNVRTYVGTNVTNVPTNVFQKIRSYLKKKDLIFKNKTLF